MCQPGVPRGQQQRELCEDISVVSMTRATLSCVPSPFTQASPGLGCILPRCSREKVQVRLMKGTALSGFLELPSLCFAGLH